MIQLKICQLRSFNLINVKSRFQTFSLSWVGILINCRRNQDVCVKSSRQLLISNNKDTGHFAKLYYIKSTKPENKIVQRLYTNNIIISGIWWFNFFSTILFWFIRQWQLKSSYTAEVIHSNLYMGCVWWRNSSRVERQPSILERLVTMCLGTLHGCIVYRYVFRN